MQEPPAATRLYYFSLSSFLGSLSGVFLVALSLILPAGYMLTIPGLAEDPQHDPLISLREVDDLAQHGVRGCGTRVVAQLLLWSTARFERPGWFS